MASHNFIERFKDKVSTINKLGEVNFELLQAVNKPNASVNPKTSMKKLASNVIRATYFSDPSSPTYKKYINSKRIEDHSFYASSEPKTEPISNKQKKALKGSYYGSKIASSEPILGGLSKKSQRFSISPSNPKKIQQSMYSTQVNLNKTDKIQVSLSPDMNHRKDFSFIPYTIDDYRLIKSDNYYELGGLGAYNIGTEEWKFSKKLQDKSKQYSKQVGKINSTLLPPIHTRKTSEADTNTRQRGIDFSKNIKRPPLKFLAYRTDDEIIRKKLEERTFADEKLKSYNKLETETRTKME